MLIFLKECASPGTNRKNRTGAGGPITRSGEVYRDLFASERLETAHRQQS